MRVLHVLGELRASGAEVMLRDAVPLFRSFSIEPLMLATGGRIGDFAEQYVAAGVKVRHLPFERKWRYLHAFYRLVRAEELDLVHVHTERANFVLGLAARAAGVPVVRTIHSVFSYQDRLKQQRRLERWLLRKFGIRHISIGPSVEDNERRRLKNPTTRVDNWIGPDFRPPDAEERLAARTAFEVPESAVVIATLGQCSEVKNHQAVLEALGLCAVHAGRPLIYLHAGYGPMEAHERELARNLHEVANIRFLGRVAEVRQLLWATDIYCMPSLYEGVGNAALEAIACGVPAVLSRVPGLVDVAEPAAGVQFVEPTAPGVAAGIAALLRDLGAARANVAELAERVAAQRSAGDAVRKMVEIYRSV
jgi:glycosyltransferase involved in cell wall biosynthesis